MRLHYLASSISARAPTPMQCCSIHRKHSLQPHCFRPQLLPPVKLEIANWLHTLEPNHVCLAAISIDGLSRH